MPSLFGGGAITPPRANIARDSSLLTSRERQGYSAQIKKNGTNSLVFVHPDRKVVGWNRHGQQHRAWQFDEKTSEIFRNIPGRGWYVFNGELLHSKTKHIKNIHFLYDILVADGVHLTGTTYQHRYDRLCETLGAGITFDTPHANDDDHIVLDQYTRIARNYHSGFARLFASLINPEDEGLVLRKPEGVYFGPKADSWMVKFRRPGITKLY